MAAGHDDCLVAGPLALVHEARANPPDDRVEPERGLHAHVHGGRQIVASADVRHLVRDDPVNLIQRQMLVDARWPDERRLVQPHRPRR